MITKRLLILLVAIVFTLSVAGLSFSAGAGKEVKGIVVKIEGSKLTILDSMGNEKTIETKDHWMLRDLKVGERVSVKDGILTKEDVKYRPLLTPARTDN